MAKAKTVSEYIAAAPKEGRAKLKEMRALLKKTAPGATEAIKWGAPTFAYKRILFAYTAIKGNISFMPTPQVLVAFKKELEKYETGKATVKFPLDKPLPKTLITKLAKFRIKESKEKDIRWM
jgi:uncharacterized protein YdhG (YjbR/CyaY superfamily)